LIIPDQSVTPVLSTSAGFYNSLHTSKRKVWIFYLKSIKPNRLWEIQHTLYDEICLDQINTQHLFEFYNSKFEREDSRDIVRELGICFVCEEFCL